ncbi:hypothetical protein IVA80_10895 [Bradyrhizobium sp. 139]|uniref:hypothetical protein n=1 Tax=Bradyrhizobium sp. 139 TaxID=2782616 RepID=UPI001FFBDC5F|nr:hypothetical protein [Bradyrhizobium sp. 139]MCK1741357.1 hypothetical protein [Bradyrhizobium sp. 139]
MNVMPNFGEDHAPEEITYHTLAAQIRAMNPRALTPQNHDDVVLLLEYLHDETVRRLDELTSKGNALAIREKEVASKERTIRIKERAVGVLLKNREGKRWFFWGRR